MCVCVYAHLEPSSCSSSFRRRQQQQSSGVGEREEALAFAFWRLLLLQPRCTRLKLEAVCVRARAPGLSRSVLQSRPLLLLLFLRRRRRLPGGKQPRSGVARAPCRAAAAARLMQGRVFWPAAAASSRLLYCAQQNNLIPANVCVCSSLGDVRERCVCVCVPGIVGGCMMRAAARKSNLMLVRGHNFLGSSLHLAVCCGLLFISLSHCDAPSIHEMPERRYGTVVLTQDKRKRTVCIHML